MKKIIIYLLFLSAIGGYSQSSPCFLGFNPQNSVFSGYSFVTSMAKGDFNSDGKMDFVFTYNTNSVRLMLGDGTGGFASSNLITFTSTSGSMDVRGLVIADYNSDGKLDIAVFRNENSNACSILMGNGNGTFLTPVVYVGNAAQFAWDSGDFNNDGKPDLVSLSSAGPPSQSTVNVLLNNGVGSFLTTQTTAIAGDSYSMIFFDFDNDGKLDIVSCQASLSSLSILKGNGNGTFATSTLSCPGYPTALATGDFNNDSFADLAVVDNSQSVVRILTGNGSGNFSNNASYSVRGGPLYIKAQDLNGDGKKDLIVLGITNEASILLGNSNGSFGQPMSYATGNGPGCLVADDFNSDSNSDILIGCGGNSANEVLMLKGIGSGIFASARTYEAGFNPLVIAAGDFNGDGYADLAATNDSTTYPNTKYIRILTNQSGLGFSAPAMVYVGSLPLAITSADYNGDGFADIAVATETAGIKILLSNGTGGFPVTNSIPTGSLNCKEIISKDINGDGKIDLALVNPSNLNLQVYKNNGSGAFFGAYGFSMNNIITMATGDFNGDGVMDLAAAGYSLMVAFGSGSGSGYSINPVVIPGVTYQNILQLYAGDFNGDGKDDLAGGGELLLANNSGGFNPAISNPYLFGFSSGVNVNDLNGDGIDDIVTLGGWNFTSILIGSSTGMFSSAIRLLSGGGFGQALGDFNKDGYTDIASSSPVSLPWQGHIGVLLNTGQQASVSISGPDIACDGIPVTITASGANSYSWDNGAITASFSAIQYTTITYTVNGFMANGCSDQAVKTISVSKITTSLASSFVCDGALTTIFASGAATYTWSTGEVGPSATVIPIGNTVYTVNGTDAAGCPLTAIAGQSVSACTAVDEFKNSASFSVYPNPASREIYFKSSGQISNEKIMLFNVTGILVKEIQVNGEVTTLDVNDLKPGIYIYRVVDNNRSVEGKLIVE